MRAALNAIFSFIGTESLTDTEFDSLTIEDLSDDNATYLELNRILNERESVSVYPDRLKHYYQAKGADIEIVDNGKSNILIGAGLCE